MHDEGGTVWVGGEDRGEELVGRDGGEGVALRGADEVAVRVVERGWGRGFVLFF